MIELDVSTDFGARVAERLQQEEVVWFTTVREDGTPQPTPVWFLWTGEEFLIFSQEKNQKLRNIEQSSKVALNFNSTEDGGDVVVFFGEATIDRSAPPASRVQAYVEKYRGGIQSLGMTPESFAADYSAPIRVNPVSVHGF